MSKDLGSTDLKVRTHEALFRAYTGYGYSKMLELATKLMKQCESTKYPQSARGIIKGEISESVLEFSLYELQKLVKPSSVIKGLCIPGLVGKVTTEMDICFFTKQRLYMFECKSYKGRKTITKECYLESTYGSANVFEQSKMHLSILDEYLHLYRKNRMMVGNHAYKMIFFEMSGEFCKDERSQEWKSRIPYANPFNLYKIMAELISKDTKENWDYDRSLEVLNHLVKESKQTFERHLHRLGAK